MIDLAEELSVPLLSAHRFTIVRRSYHVIASEGLANLSLRKLASALGISPALINYHFGSYDALILATMEWAVTATVGRIQRAVRDVADPVAAFESVIGAILNDAQNNREFYLVYFELVQLAARRPNFGGIRDMALTHITGTFELVIARGVEAGAFRIDDSWAAARTTRAILEGHAVQWVQEEDWASTHEQFREDCLRALHALLGVRLAVTFDDRDHRDHRDHSDIRDDRDDR